MSQLTKLSICNAKNVYQALWNMVGSCIRDPGYRKNLSLIRDPQHWLIACWRLDGEMICLIVPFLYIYFFVSAPWLLDLFFFHGCVNCVVGWIDWLRLIVIASVFYGFLRLFASCLIASVLTACLRSFVEGILRLLGASLMMLCGDCLFMTKCSVLIFLDYLFTAVYRRDICTALLFVWLRLLISSWPLRW